MNDSSSFVFISPYKQIAAASKLTVGINLENKLEIERERVGESKL